MKRKKELGLYQAWQMIIFTGRDREGKFVIYLLLIIIGFLLYIEIDKLKKQIKSQQKQIDALCKQTGNKRLATYYILDEDKEYILHLKNSGKEVEAVKRVREITTMELVEAKQYVDLL